MVDREPAITRQQLLVSLGVMAGIAVAALDSTVVGTAMPTIIGQLGGIEQYGWVFAAYLLTATTTVPIFSTLADQHGRKPIFLVGLALFVGGSALSGLSGSMAELIAFRAIQGLGAGAVQPIAFTIVGDIFEPRQRARIQGLFSSVWGVAAVVGPAIGGIITATVGWRWVFYLNVPVGLLAATLIATVHREGGERRRHRLDLLGATTLTGGVALLLLFASEVSEARSLTPPVAAPGIASIVLLIAFARNETRATEPLISLALLRRPIVAAGLAVGTLAGIVMFGLTAYVPPLVQGVMGGTPLEAGLAVGAMSLGWPIGSIAAGRAILRVGVRPVVLLGTFLLFAGSGILVAAGVVTWLWFVATAAAVVGLGMGLTTTPLLVGAQTAVAWNERGQATGLLQFSRTIGGAVGTGLLGALLSTAVGPTASAVLDPIARLRVSPADLETVRAALGAGLASIYAALFVAALGAWLIAIRLVPAARIGHRERGESETRDSRAGGRPPSLDERALGVTGIAPDEGSAFEP